MCLGHCAQHAGPVIGAALSTVGVGSNGGKQTREGGRKGAAAAAAAASASDGGFITAT